MKRIIVAIVSVCFALGVTAQPAKSRVAENNAKNATTATTKSTTAKTTTTTAKTTSKAQTVAPSVSRASIMFPTAVDVPVNVAWRRDIYRELDLTKDENAALYYPVEPQDGRVNLFTLLFQLLNQGKIPAYDYETSGIENFSKENRMHFKDMLDRHEITYEVSGNTIKVNPIDIPSNEVLSYFVKESSYYDQNTATYHSRVVAICPVLHRADEFSMATSKRPLFWVKIDDIETYLSQNMVMTSNINNAATMSMADFFATNRYKGKIYMTNNMQGKVLMQTVESDSALVNEQKRIEKELVDFEKNIWSTPVDSAALAKRDSIAAAAQASKKVKQTATRTTARTEKAESAKSSKSSAPKSSGSSAPRVSVRRERH